MPTTIDWPPRHSSRSRGLRFFLILVGIFVVIIFGRSLLSYFVDLLWFRSLGYGSVFSTTLLLEWTIFVLFAVATFAILYGCFVALRRTHLPDLPSTRTIYFGGQPLSIPVEPVMRVLALGGSIMIALVTGAGMMGEWSTYALFWSAPHATSTVVDPVFGKPLNFFLFALPAWQLISGWLLTVAFITCGIAVFFLLITGAAEAFAGRRSYLTVPWRGLSFTLAFLLLILAWRVYLSRYDFLFETHTVFTGVTYTDAHLNLGGLLLLSLALIAGAGALIVNAVSAAKGRWIVAATLPAIIVFVIVHVAGWWMSSFIVKPNELVRERPYIADNILMTRQAYGLDRFVQREFPAETTVGAADAANNQPTLQNIRLWDWQALQDTLRQIQEIRTYYDFPDIDIDRYQIQGDTREVMLATRELNVEKLPESSRNWINEKLIYTHGYGITMNPVNGFTPEGLPILFMSNMPVQSTIPGLNVTRPEIYFGELTDTDVYVKTRQQEFNYPQGQTNSLTSYEGSGGIVLGGFFRRLVLAIDRGDLAKLPFSDDVTPQSRLLMRRNVRDRVNELAPFLTYDQDPYIVVGADGRLSWVMDAFTTSDQYPDSSHYRLGDDTVNYMRNSVKVVIDAYDGTTTFYVFDTQDPIINGYRRIFPSLFKDAAEMPAGLRKHMRYPELLLKMQGEVYGLYHMTNPEVFYNREDLWTVATEVGSTSEGGQTAQPMQPNYVLMKLPDGTNMEFVEILPFTPANRNNLIGWIGGRSDGPNYGTAVVYNFPKNKLVDGPLQIEARIDQNAELSGQLTLWNQQGSHVRRGTLLVIPTGKALLYAEPIYLQAERSPMPELRLVVLALQDRLVYGSTFEAALTALFGGANSSLTATEQRPAAAAATAAPQSATDLSPTIAEAARDLADYQRLTAEGKLGEAGQKLEELKRAIDKLNSRPQ
jgi:uncharacterized membrane protein (UPF0182 family)